MQNFYHGAGAAIVAGSANFAARILADAVSLGIAPAQATSFGLLNATLQTAWTASESPETRTKASIAGRNTAIANMRAAAIPLARQIAGNPAVSDEELILLGLLPRTSPSPIVPDTTAPELDMLGVNGRTVKIRVRQIGAEGRARPKGSIGAYIFTAVGPVAPTDPSGYKFQGIAPKSVVTVLFDDDVASGATVWIAAAWAYARGARGFACPAVSTNLPGGSVLAAEPA